MNTVEGWKNFRVREICDLGRGRVISAQEIEQNPGIFPVYSSQSTNDGKMGAIDTFDFDGEYVTWTTDGAYAGTVFYRSGKFNCTNVCGTLQAKEPHLSMSFIAYNLSTLTKNHVSYVGNPKLMNGVMANIELSIPIDPAEQFKIVEILSTVDRAIEETESLIAKQQRIKTGLMQDLLTRGIDEQGNLRSEQTHKFKDSPLGRIPVEWEVKQSSELVNILNGGTPSTSNKEYWTGGTLPWLSVEDFNNNKRFVNSAIKHITKKGLKNSAAIILPKYSIIISARGTVGVISQLSCDMAFNQSCYGLMSKDDKTLSNHFLYYSLKQIFATNRVATSGSVFDTITRKTFDEILIPFPKNKEEAGSIVDVLSQQDIFIEEMGDNFSKISFLKTALMQDLLTGKKRVFSLLEDAEVARV